MAKKVIRGASITAILAALGIAALSLINKEEKLLDKNIQKLKTEIVQTSTKTKEITRNSTWAQALSEIEKLAQKRTRLNKLREEVNDLFKLFNKSEKGKKSISESINQRTTIRPKIREFILDFDIISKFNEEQLKIWIKLGNGLLLSDEEEYIYIYQMKKEFPETNYNYFVTKVINGAWNESDPYEEQSYLAYANDLFIEFLEKAKHDLITGLEAIEEGLKIINSLIDEIEYEGDPEEILKTELNKLYQDKLYFEETQESLKDDLSYTEDVIEQRKAMTF